ncbi:MAG: hypothetical protein ACI8T1_002199 [Verrucomicrobiales bacterium]|jgi:hypothetical protein
MSDPGVILCLFVVFVLPLLAGIAVLVLFVKIVSFFRKGSKKKGENNRRGSEPPSRQHLAVREYLRPADATGIAKPDAVEKLASEGWSQEATSEAQEYLSRESSKQ